MSSRQLDAELDAARDDEQFAGLDFENAELGGEAERALLGHDQHFSVGGVEEAVGHGGGGGIDVDADAFLHVGVAVAADSDDAFDEIGGFGGEGQGVPAHLVGRRRLFVEWTAADEGLRGEGLIGFVDDEGRMRYIQVRRFWPRGAVKAEPLTCSV